MNQSHKRLNILTGEWVLVSPHRMKRPWQGKQEKVEKTQGLKYDKTCYLCPTNIRANDAVNEDYKSVFIFENDFGALQLVAQENSTNGLFISQAETGICKVICYSPDHSKSMANLSSLEIENIIQAWQNEYKTLGALPQINYVQIFENKGDAMGCSNPHPHGQIWAQGSLPNEVEKKHQHQLDFFAKNQKSILEVYVGQELETQERILFENEEFVVLVPFWAVWPYETMILPKMQQKSILEIKNSAQFAEAISVLTKVYDKLFDCSFPYSCGIHQAPTNAEKNEFWHWHMSFYPPLLRSATVKKFMVGYEMFGMPQRDITAEFAAAQLKSLINN